MNMLATFRMKTFIKISLSLLSGLLLAAAWPARGLTALIFIALIPIFAVEDMALNGKERLFPYSTLAFLTWNVLTTWWIWNASPAAILAFVINALLMATVLQLYHLCRKKTPTPISYVFLITLWLSIEWLTQHWSLKWPWLNLGNAFSPHPDWIQWYEYTGTAGGTIWILLVNILIFNLVKSIIEYKSRKKVIVKAVVSACAIAIPILNGEVIYHNYEEKGETTEVVIVQQNEDPWHASGNNIDRNLRLADSLVTDNTAFVIGSELTINDNFWLDRGETKSVKRLHKFVKIHPNTAIIIGAETFEKVPKGMENDFAARRFSNSEGRYFTHNSALLIDSAGLQMRHKTQLVPGAESMPRWTGFLRHFAATAPFVESSLKGDTIVRNIAFREHNAAVMICYESAFGGYVARHVKQGADILFIITNDGWWGDTPGHRQHFEMARLRAIENRRCVAQSANTGISGFINQRGDVIQKTDYWTETTIRTTLQANNETTFYSRHGDYLYIIALFANCAMVIVLLIYIMTAGRGTAKHANPSSCHVSDNH